MNERIRALWVEADKLARPSGQSSVMMEKFAELIIEECMYVGRLAQLNNQLVDTEINEHFGVEE